MPKIELIDLLARARENEKRYDWIAAVEFHEKSLGHLSQQRDSLRAGEVAERIGYCFHRAAMQAKDRSEFEDKMKMAIGAYQRAQGFYELLPDPQKAGSKLRSIAVATYLSYWLASDGVEKRKLLDECLELEDKALTHFLQSGKMLEYCRTYNALWPVFFFRGYLEWDGQALLRLINRGMEWGRKVISALSEHDNPYEVAWAYFTSATCLTFVASIDPLGVFIVDPDEMEKNRLEVIASIEKALVLSEKLEDAFLTGLLHLWLGFNIGRLTASRSNYEKALDSGVITRDNFLNGASLEMLAYNTNWQNFGESTQRRKLMEAVMEFYDKALQHNSITHFQNPLRGPITAPFGRAAYYFEKAKKWETDQRKRKELLEMAENAGIEALKLARNSDMPGTIAGALFTLSKILTERARLDSDLAQKRNRLKKAIEYREELIKIEAPLGPFDYFNHGLLWSYFAETKANLSEVESNPHERKRLLQEAVMHKERSIELCTKMIPYYERIGWFNHLPVLGEILDRCAAMLTNLHGLTKQSDNLRRAIEMLHEAIKSAKKQDLVSLEAEF